MGNYHLWKNQLIVKLNNYSNLCHDICCWNMSFHFFSSYNNITPHWESLCALLSIDDMDSIIKYFTDIRARPQNVNDMQRVQLKEMTGDLKMLAHFLKCQHIKNVIRCMKEEAQNNMGYYFFLFFHIPFDSPFILRETKS